MRKTLIQSLCLIFLNLLSGRLEGSSNSAQAVADQFANQYLQGWLQKKATRGSSFSVDLSIHSREKTKQGKIVVHRYQQKLDSFLVQDSDFRVWTRYDKGKWVVVYVHSQLLPRLPMPWSRSFLKQDEVVPFLSKANEWRRFNQWSKPEAVIFFQNLKGEQREPTRAWKVRAQRYSNELKESQLLFVDSHSREILDIRNDFAGVNATGNVSAYVTPGVLPDSLANPPSQLALASLTVNLSGGVAASDFTDANGDYSIVDADVGNVNVQAELLGERVNVNDALAADLNFTQLGILNNDVVDIIFNSTAQTEFSTAQANAYYYTQAAYDFFRSRSVGLAGLNAPVAASVNRLNAGTDCEASYVAGEMRFYRANLSCRNSAFSTVIAHEYGHHIVNTKALPVSNSFSEGFADSYAMLMFDVAGVGFDLRMDDDFLRNPVEADVQYPCSGTDYFCGQVLSAIWYKLADRLGLAAAQQLFVDWAVATAGGNGTNAAHPITAAEILAQDDDDADLENGTPNQEIICDVFGEHNIECPRVLTFTLTNIPKVVDPLAAPPTISLVMSAGTSNPQDATGVFYYRIDGGDWVQVVMTNPAANNYTVTLPALLEGQQIDFYFSAETAAGTLVVFPSDAPMSFYSAIAESPARDQIALSLPRAPTLIKASDLRTGGANRRLYVLPEAGVNGLLSFTSTNFDNFDLIATQLPDGFSVGSQSLFYSRTESSDEIVFTDNARRRVYYASRASGDLVVDPKFCGDFQTITDIHLTEVAGNLSRLIVLDGSANRVYSYAIDLSNPSLCIGEVAIDLQGPEWVRSSVVGAGNPSLYIGSRFSNRLRVGRYQDNTLGMLTGIQSLANHREARFGGVLFDSSNNQLVVGISRATGSEFGDDHIRYYNADMSATGTVSTCRSPDDLQQDHANYIYVFCRSAKKIDVLDSSDSFSRLGRVEAGAQPIRFSITQDGTNRFISILQKNSRVYLHRFPQAATDLLANLTSAYLSLAPLGTDATAFGSTDELYIISREGNSFYQIDLTTQSLTNTIAMPRTINALVAQSASIQHFISKETDRVYSLEEVATDNYRVRQHLVGDHPVQIGYRTNRLYVLNRDSDSLSIVDISGTPYTTVDTLPTQDRPIDFVFNTAVNQLWAINEGSQSFSTFDIDTAGPEALIDHTILGFIPRKLAYETSDTTLYIGGEESVRVINQPNRATVKTETLPNRLSDLKLSNAGVIASSAQGLDLHFVSRGAFTRTALTSSPDFLATNSTLTVAGLAGQNKLFVSGNLFNVQSFQNLFSTAAHFMTFQKEDDRLQLYPFALTNSETLPSISFRLENLIPTQVVADSSNNFVVLDGLRQKFLRINSSFQVDEIRNAVLNRATDITSWDAEDRVYVSLRSINAVLVFDDVNDIGLIYRVCESPSKVSLDSVNSKLFVLCPRESIIAVLTLDANGDPSAIAYLATDQNPIDMQVNSSINRLYVVNKNSDSVQVFNSTNNALVTRAETGTRPVAIDIDASGNEVLVVSESSREITRFPGATGDPVTETFTDTTMLGLRRIAVNSGSNQIYALNSVQGTVYTGSLDFTGTGLETRNAIPRELAISEAQDKAIVSFPSLDRVQIYDESGPILSEVVVGDGPQDLYIIESLNRAYIANFEGHSVSVLDLTNNSVTATIPLSAGCGPTKMTSADIAGVLYLYVICESIDQVDVIHTGTNSLSSSISLRL